MASRSPRVLRTITVGLVARADTALRSLTVQYTQPDAVNRAVITYDFIQRQLDQGKELAIHDPKSGTFQLVYLRSAGGRRSHLKIVEPE